MRKPITLVGLLGTLLSLASVVGADGAAGAAPVALITADCMSVLAANLATLGIVEAARDGPIEANSSSVADLVALIGPPNIGVPEPAIWTIDARVQRFRLASDGDTIQVVVADASDPSLILSAEFLDPKCLSPADAPLGKQAQAVRDTLVEICGNPTPDFQPCGAQVRLTGFGAFAADRAELPADAAPNGFELMPVLAFEPRGISLAAPPLAAQPPAPAEATPMAVQTGLATEQAQITAVGSGKRISGVGTQDSAPFLLDAGAYHIEWTARTSANEPANFAAFVKPVDPTAPGWMFVANAIVRPEQGQVGTIEATGAQTGAYYLSAIGASAWTVTLTRSLASLTRPLADLPRVDVPHIGITPVPTPGLPGFRTPFARPPRSTPLPPYTPRPTYTPQP
jgi:hypothetical protein